MSIINGKISMFFWGFFVISIARVEGSTNYTDLMRHVLPVYAIAEKFHILEKSNCRDELEIFKKAVDNRKLWSLKMLDSSGVAKSGFMFGNNYWMGSRQQCYDLLNPEPLALHPKWLKNNSLFRNPNEELAPFKLHYFAALFYHNSTLQYHHRLASEDVVTLGLCLPATCGTADVELLLEKIFDERILSIGELYAMDFKLLEVKDLEDHPDYLLNWRMIVVISLIIATLIMMAVGTYCDVISKRKIQMNKSTEIESNCNSQQISDKSAGVENVESSSASSPGGTSAAVKILRCFSVYTNFINLFKTSLSENSIPCLHGIRFLGMIWIIVIHSGFFVRDIADNRTYGWRFAMTFHGQIFSNATLSVDTFFFMSGFLLTHGFFINNKREENKRKGFGWGKIAQALLHRFVRLTPAYMIVIGIAEMNGHFYGNTSQFYMTERPQDTCAKYWWRNLIYINNFFSRDEMCLSWSWYLSNDTQFFLFGIILLFLSVRHFYIAGGILLSTLAASSVISGYFAYIYDYSLTLDGLWNTLSIFYDPPWMRIGPYLVGVATGYLLVKLKNKLPVKRRTVWILWIIGSCCNLLVLFGPYDRTNSVIATSIYMALHRTVWALGIAWVVVACCTNNAGIVNSILTLKLWVPLSKLTFSVYLLNPFLISSVYLNKDSADHLEFLPLGTIAFGFMIMTYLCAIVMSLMFETPYILLLKLIYNSRTKK